MSDPNRTVLAELLAGRRVVVAMQVLVEAASVVTQLEELGAEGVLVLAGSRGTGAVEADLERRALLLGVRGDELMAGIRAFEAALAELPDPARRAVEAFDPDGRAQVITPFFSQRETVAGRPVFGARRAAWRRLEDKTRVDPLWDAAGVPRVESEVVPAERRALRAAGARLDRGRGTVWVADNRTGFHGGAQLLRWVRDDRDAERASEFLIERAHRIRVMPFLEGLPCSIHGWVFPDRVVALHPCETLVLRDGEGRLWYAGAGASWRASPADRRAMREIARRTGRYLRARVGYRGVFTVDGVMTAEGFRPTELNPRFGAALGMLGRPAGLPLYLLHLATIEHPELEWRPAELERRILAAADRQVIARAGLVIPGHRVEETSELSLVRRDERWVAAEGHPRPRARLQLGPSPAGSFLRITLPTHAPGRPAGPVVASLVAAARRRWELPLPELTAAPDPRAAARRPPGQSGEEDSDQDRGRRPSAAGGSA